MNNTEEINLKEIIDVILKNKLLILLITFLFLVGAYLVVYFSTPVYKTFGTVEISSGNNANANDQVLQALNLYAGPSNLNTEIEIIKSRSMVLKALNYVNFTKRYFIVHNFKTTEILSKDFPFEIEIDKIKQFSLIIEPLNIQNAKLILFLNGKKDEKIITFNKWVEVSDVKLKIDKKKSFKEEDQYKVVVLNKVDVANTIKSKLIVSQVAPKASIIKVSFSDNIPQRDADFINALMKVYIKESVQKKTQQLDQTLKFIDNQLKIISKKLAESELALENFKKKNKVIDIPTEAQSIMQKLNDLQTTLNQIFLQENMIKFIQDKINEAKTTSLISADILNDQVLSDLISQLQQLLLKKQDLLIQYTSKHPAVIQINEQIRILKQMIVNRIENIKQVLEAKKKNIQLMINTYTKMLEKLPQNERKLVDLTRTYQVNEKIYSYLLEKRAATSLAKSSIVSDNRVIDTALVPKYPYKPKKKIILLIGFVLGLIVGVALAILKEFLSTKIKSVDDIKKLTDVAIIGTVPHFKNTSRILKVFDSPKSAVSEAFRVIRTNIRFLSPKDTEIITVTSTVSGEGKTTISSNIAGIYAMAGKKTILVNLDLRKPALHKVFGIENRLGLSNVLAGEKSIEEVIQKTDYENLSVIPSGPIPPNPGELLQSEKMDEIIEYLNKNYEIVVFDTPPVGLVVDSINILIRSDVNIYIFRANYSKKDFVKVLNDLKQNKNIKGLGIVVNDIKDKNSGYGYGYGYGYGKGYYTE
jgi:capsular exopolysaccharide synthesis family protein